MSCLLVGVSIMQCRRLRRMSFWLSLAAAAALTASQAGAQDAIANFYRGKTITISVGFSAGGGYDLHARTLARLFGKHVPGNPTVVVKNVPGAGGLMLMNALSNTLPKDGTEFATFDRGMALEPLLDPDKARYDSRKLNWIGSTDNDASTCFAWHTAAVKTFDDVLQHELIVSGTGTAGDAVLFPRLLNDVLQTKFKVITGYPGSTESLLAMERGETQGFCSMGFVTLEVTRPQWVKDKKVNVLVQFALQKNKDHLDVPLGARLRQDHARPAGDRIRGVAQSVCAAVRSSAGRADGARRGAAAGVQRHHGRPRLSGRRRRPRHARPARDGRGDRGRAEAHLRHSPEPVIERVKRAVK